MLYLPILLAIFFILVLAIIWGIKPESIQEVILISIIIPYAFLILLTYIVYLGNKTIDLDGLLYARKAFTWSFIPTIISGFTVFFLLKKKMGKSIKLNSKMNNETVVLKKPAIYLIAVSASSILAISYAIIVVLFEWKNGGGVFPLGILFGSIVITWKFILGFSSDRKNQK